MKLLRAIVTLRAEKNREKNREKKREYYLKNREYYSKSYQAKRLAAVQAALNGAEREGLA